MTEEKAWSCIYLQAAYWLTGFDHPCCRLARLMTWLKANTHHNVSITTLISFLPAYLDVCLLCYLSWFLGHLRHRPHPLLFIIFNHHNASGRPPSRKGSLRLPDLQLNPSTACSSAYCGGRTHPVPLRFLSLSCTELWKHPTSVPVSVCMCVSKITLSRPPTDVSRPPPHLMCDTKLTDEHLFGHWLVKWKYPWSPGRCLKT